jgi:cyclomaltodextrinase / maltogenic alpha-amylase / neopullulanase
LNAEAAIAETFSDFLSYLFFMKYLLLLSWFLIATYPETAASSIFLHTRSAVIWLPQQTIFGSVVDLNATEVIVHINDSTFTTNISDNRFSFKVTLTSLKSKIWAETKQKDKAIQSDTIVFELGFKPLPVVKPFATHQNNLIKLNSDLVYNPYNRPLSYHWLDDKRNPAPVKINNAHTRTATVDLPKKRGTYYFNLRVTDGNDSATYQTFIIKTDSVHCFDMETDHAAWIDTAIVYQIYPRVFVKNGTYDDIAKKLPELKKIGINTIWLQPVFGTHLKGQGYEIVDYFSLRPDYGDEVQMQQLISDAKSLNIKVLFDIVPNHTSIFHPYAIDCIKHRESHYYDFYQRRADGAKYSSLYHTDSLGFLHYRFWDHLINLNYENEEVQRWMLEASKYWLRKFDIDGYRFDAVWAVNARSQDFGKRLQAELKSIKPDIFLLAEDKGADPDVYKKGFDAAYDWEIDTTWISHWSWQYEYSAKNDLTIFNHPDVKRRDDLLYKALFQNGDTRGLRLRFIENNDVPRFIKIHGVERTKMAAALEFSLPGIPLIYNGQEIGSHAHPYTSQPIFFGDKSIQSLDTSYLFQYYQQLIRLRNQYKSLHGTNIKPLSVTGSDAVLAYHRWMDDEHVMVVVNMGDTSQRVKISVDGTGMIRNKKTYILNDMLSNETFPISSGTVSLNMEKYTTRILMVEAER